MSLFVHHLRHAVRALAATPGFAATALLTLALGIGANAAIFTVVHAVLLRPLPFHEPDRLVMIWEHARRLGDDRVVVSYPNFEDWRAQSRAVGRMAAYSPWTVNVTGIGQPERAPIALVSATFFDVLGVPAELGRVFAPADEARGRDHVVVLTRAALDRWFGGDPAAVGSAMTLDGEPFTIVGVVAAGPELPALSGEVGIFLPITQGFGLDNRQAHYLQVVGRLADGVTLEQARIELSTIADRLAVEYPRSNTDFGATIVPLRDQLVGDVRPALLVLFGVVGLVLLIACANLANMLLARATGRQWELAIRAALGARRGQLAAQALVESLLLAVAGGGLGVLAALWGVDLLVRLAPADVPRLAGTRVDGAVLLFTFGLAVVTGAVFGLLPAWHAARADVNNALKDAARGSSGPGRQRARQAIVVAEIAVSLVVLASAGLMLKSFLRLSAADPGFRADHLLTVRLDLPASRYRSEDDQRRFHAALLDRARRIPGVVSAATITGLPLGRGYSNRLFSIEGRPSTPDTPTTAYYNGVSESYFETMGIPLVRGRVFTDADAPDSTPVLVVNSTFARKFFPGEDPIGWRIGLGRTPIYFTIVGLVGDVKNLSLGGGPEAQMYAPYRQSPDATMTLVVRTATEPAALGADLRAAVAAIDQEEPVYDLQTMRAVVSASVAEPRFRAWLVGLFAGLALLLVAVGLYGVIAYSVAQRVQEIGIRLALGGGPGDILRLILGQALGLSALGTAIGLAAAYGVTRALQGLLFGIASRDPGTLAGVVALLALVTVIAAWVPARRAMRVDAMEVLRSE